MSEEANMPILVTIEEINAEQDRRALLSMACTNHASVIMGWISSGAYVQNCLALQSKLGFLPTRDALQAATDELLGETP